MNGVLNSEAILNSFEHSYTEHNGLKAVKNFSDLVPFFVTVESVSDYGYYSFNQLNPMTASNFSDNAVIKHPIAEVSLKKTGLDILGTGSSCTPTVTFLKN